MLDYYRLPLDFPGQINRLTAHSPEDRVLHVENAIAAHFNSGQFLPFLALHEFEAWVFACPDTLPSVMAETAKQPRFADVCSSVVTPELINERPGQNPAARIMAIFPAYRKILHGLAATKRIGLRLIRSQCPHFDQWLGKLEAFAAA